MDDTPSLESPASDVPAVDVSVIAPVEPDCVPGVLSKKEHKDAVVGMLETLPIGFTLGQLRVLDVLLDKLKAEGDVVLTKEEKDVIVPLFDKFQNWSFPARKMLFTIYDIIK